MGTLIRASTAEECGICLTGGVRLLNFSGRCCHRFCSYCLDRCTTYQHDLCPLCRAPRTTPHAQVASVSEHTEQEIEIGSSGRFEDRMLLELAGLRHTGMDYFG